MFPRRNFFLGKKSNNCEKSTFNKNENFKNTSLINHCKICLRTNVDLEQKEKFEIFLIVPQ